MKCACECHKEKKEEAKADFEIKSLRDGTIHWLCVTCFFNKSVDWIKEVQKGIAENLVKQAGFGLN